MCRKSSSVANNLNYLVIFYIILHHELNEIHIKLDQKNHFRNNNCIKNMKIILPQLNSIKKRKRNKDIDYYDHPHYLYLRL